jgi:hypothetical protein
MAALRSHEIKYAQMPLMGKLVWQKNAGSQIVEVLVKIWVY